MVKSPHEALHRIFQEDPRLCTRAFAEVLGFSYAHAWSVSVIDSNVTEMLPLERRVDTALLFETAVGKQLVIVESQSKPDDEKRRPWPYYVAYMHSKYDCPVNLLVVTADKVTADWARKPIRVGGSLYFPVQVTRPEVLSPDNVQAVLDVDEARRDVMMTVFSALIHRHGPQINEVLDALAAALAEVDYGTVRYLAQFIDAGLDGSKAATVWRNMMNTMTYPYQSKLRLEWTDEGRQEGELKGEAKTLLAVLRARGLAVPEEVERRVLECTDKARLDVLVTRAVSVERAEDLFD